MALLCWVGPCAVVASIAYMYSVNHGSSSHAAPITTRFYCLFLFVMYAGGFIPRCGLFPSVVYKANIFGLLYKLYCTDTVGYKVLKNVMHQPASYPHSDYRVGARMLSGGMASGYTHCKVVLAGSKAAAVAAAAERTPKGESCSYYGRGSEYLDMTQIGKRAKAGCQGGVFVMPVAIFADNYAYILGSLETKKVALVDPADPTAVIHALNAVSKYFGTTLQVTDILTTHKHWDHAGGNKDICELATCPQNVAKAERGENPIAVDLAIYGPAKDRPMGCNKFVADGNVFTVAGGGVTVRALEVPGHTEGSVVYLAGDSAATADDKNQYAALFTGDSLFSGGCGAPFETTSVAQVRQTRRCFVEDPRGHTHPASDAELDDDHVLVYVGHEYTERLLQEMHTITSKRIEGPNCPLSVIAYGAAVDKALQEVKALRAESNGLEDVAKVGGGKSGAEKPIFRLPASTIPTTLGIEKRVNPLLTMDAGELDYVESASKELDSARLERAIYCSKERVMPSS